MEYLSEQISKLLYKDWIPISDKVWGFPNNYKGWFECVRLSEFMNWHHSVSSLLLWIQKPNSADQCRPPILFSSSQITWKICAHFPFFSIRLKHKLLLVFVPLEFFIQVRTIQWNWSCCFNEKTEAALSVWISFSRIKSKKGNNSKPSDLYNLLLTCYQSALDQTYPTILRMFLINYFCMWCTMFPIV